MTKILYLTARFSEFAKKKILSVRTLSAFWIPSMQGLNFYLLKRMLVFSQNYPVLGECLAKGLIWMQVLEITAQYLLDYKIYYKL